MSRLADLIVLAKKLHDMSQPLQIILSTLELTVLKNNANEETKKLAEEASKLAVVYRDSIIALSDMIKKEGDLNPNFDIEPSGIDEF